MIVFAVLVAAIVVVLAASGANAASASAQKEAAPVGLIQAVTKPGWQIIRQDQSEAIAVKGELGGSKWNAEIAPREHNGTKTVDVEYWVTVPHRDSAPFFLGPSHVVAGLKTEFSNKALGFVQLSIPLVIEQSLLFSSVFLQEAEEVAGAAGTSLLATDLGKAKAILDSVGIDADWIYRLGADWLEIEFSGSRIQLTARGVPYQASLVSGFLEKAEALTQNCLDSPLRQLTA